METEQRHLQCSSLSPPLAKASAALTQSAEAFFKEALELYLVVLFALVAGLILSSWLAEQFLEQQAER